VADGNRRSNYHCSLATTTRNSAARNEAGITQIFSAHPEKTHTIPAYGRLTFWSCQSPSDATPAGAITELICPGNRLCSVEFTGLTELRHLDVSYNDLEMLDLSGLTALRTLECPGEPPLYTLYGGPLQAPDSRLLWQPANFS